MLFGLKVLVEHNFLKNAFCLSVSRILISEKHLILSQLIWELGMMLIADIPDIKQGWFKEKVFLVCNFMT